jgi:tetratricopeptide (TPR) repeat protein
LSLSNLTGLALAACTVIVFSPALGNNFVNYDDELYVTGNPDVLSGLNAPSIGWAFHSTQASNWHPLTWISLELDAEVYGDRPRGFHLTSVLLHSVTVWLLCAWLTRTTGALAASALAAAFFGWHPLRVESVAWVSERKDVLSGLFLMLTLWMYERHVRRGQASDFVAAIILYACGLMSKPTLVSGPFLLLLLDYWPLDRFGRRSKARGPRSEAIPRSRHFASSSEPAFPSPPPGGRGQGEGGPGRRHRFHVLLEKLPFFVLAALSATITWMVQRRGGALVTAAQLPWAYRLDNALAGIAVYLRQTVWPTQLMAFYPYDLTSHLRTKATIGLGLLLLVSIAALAYRRRMPYLFVGWFWFLIALVPMLGIVQVGTQAHADRYTYIPSIGLAIAVAWPLAESRAAQRIGRRFWAVAGFIALLVLALMAGNQCRYWHDSERLWGHALQIGEQNYVAHFSMGLALRQEGKLDEAIEHYKRAVELDPNYPEAEHNLGAALAMQKKYPEAIVHFQKALSINPARPNTWSNLAKAYAEQGDFEHARAAAQKAAGPWP